MIDELDLIYVYTFHLNLLKNAYKEKFDGVLISRSDIDYIYFNYYRKYNTNTIYIGSNIIFDKFTKNFKIHEALYYNTGIYFSEKKIINDLNKLYLVIKRKRKLKNL